VQTKPTASAVNKQLKPSDCVLSVLGIMRNKRRIAYLSQCLLMVRKHVKVGGAVEQSVVMI